MEMKAATAAGMAAAVHWHALLLAGAAAVHAAAAPPRPSDRESPTEIHVVFSNHLDIGFNDRSWNIGDESCDGLFSPDGEPCLPLAANVTSENFNVSRPGSPCMCRTWAIYWERRQKELDSVLHRCKQTTPWAEQGVV